MFLLEVRVAINLRRSTSALRACRSRAARVMPVDVCPEAKRPLSSCALLPMVHL